MFVSAVMYFNILIFQLIVYAEYQDYTLKSLLKNTFLYEFIPDLHFSSMTREWFSDVGTGIILTMIIKIANPAIAIFCLSVLKRLFVFF